MPTVAYRMMPFELRDVQVESIFWTPLQETNRTATLAAEYKMCKDTGRLEALKLQWKKGEPNAPHIFWESDLAKWLEAASYSLATHPDEELQKLVDEVVGLIVSAQQSDGYINAHYTVVEPGKRWTNVRDQHELYGAGHLMEAAVAHYHATGKHTLLDALIRYADYIGTVFGRGPGQKRGYCGHEEIELALVKLYHATGQRKYFELAKYFIDERGREPHYYNLEAIARGDQPMDMSKYAYSQAHKPVREQSEVVGHAVRAFYLYSGMADVAALSDDATLLAACKRLWSDAVLHKMYVTGAVGPSAHNEGFTRSYDLPNESAYAETCANIALAFFAHRMLQIEADGQYADVMERIFYNSSISGVSLNGQRFFYCNPLASVGAVERKDWFGCACCPPNIARFIASLGAYIYSSSDRAAYVHLYVGGSGKARVGNTDVTLTQKTDYPWDGQVEITVGLGSQKPARFDLMLRIPFWCRKHKVALNGKSVSGKVVKGYLRLSRVWQDGDVVTLTLAMPVERVVAHPEAADDIGKVALQRGPVVYCLEQVDNKAPVRQIALGDRAKLTARFDKRTLGGVVVVEGTGTAPDLTKWKKSLYLRPDQTTTRKMKFRAVPYAFWNNRGPCPMTVWMPRSR